MKTIIMAGGKGTRISHLFPDLPKPLIPINGRPILEWELKSLKEQGFKDITITVSYLYEKIIDYFGDGSDFGVNINYFIEKQPLGNAGALYKMNLQEDFLLLNADALFEVDFQRMVAFHKANKALATLFTHPNAHPYDSGLIITDGSGQVIRWLTREESRPTYYKNRVNAGVHVISPKTLSMNDVDSNQIGRIGKDGRTYKVDLDRHVLKPLCGRGVMFAYDSPEYVKDMGTPERYESVCRDMSSGIVHSKNMRNKQKAIFLDRDGTINVYKGFLRDINDLELIDGVSDAIKQINQSGYLCIVVTNQPVIARGEVTIPELQEIHNKLETILGQQGAYIDGLYYCPHHPHKGFEGEVAELKIECDCRKPKPGMLLEAARDFNIDLKNSWMVGDGENDILAGKTAGCHTALITKENEDAYGADVVIPNLNAFTSMLFQ